MLQRVGLRVTHEVTIDNEGPIAMTNSAHSLVIAEEYDLLTG